MTVVTPTVTNVTLANVNKDLTQSITDSCRLTVVWVMYRHTVPRLQKHNDNDISVNTFIYIQQKNVTAHMISLSLESANHILKIIVCSA